MAIVGRFESVGNMPRNASAQVFAVIADTRHHVAGSEVRQPCKEEPTHYSPADLTKKVSPTIMCRMVYSHFSSSPKDYSISTRTMNARCSCSITQANVLCPLRCASKVRPSPTIELERITTLRFVALAMPYAVDIRAPYPETGS